MQSTVVKGILLTLLGGILWGFSGMCSQFIQQVKGMPTDWLVTMRLLTAGVITIGLAIVKDGKQVFQIFTHGKDVLQLIIFGIFGMWMCQYTYFKAIAYAGAGIATVLQYVGPAFVIVYVALRQMKLPRLAEVLSVVLAMVGTAIIALQGTLDVSALDATLLCWGMLSAISLGIYTVQPGSIIKTYGTLPIVGYGMFIGGIFSWLVLQPSDVGTLWDGWTHAAFWSIIILGSVVSFSAYLEGVTYIGAVTGSILSSVEPISAAVLAWVILGNEFTQPDIIGMVLILLTIFILAYDKQRASS